VDLNAILDGIKKAGQQQILQIQQEAEQQASKILAGAEKEAEMQQHRILSDGHARLNREQALIAQQAQIRTLQIHADARQQLIETAINNALKNLSELREKTVYARILKNFVNESIEAITPSLINNQKIIIHFDPRDKLISEKILKNFSLNLSAKYDLECSGGCVAETEDGMVRALNTIESRFEHDQSRIKQDLSLFFESELSTG